MAFTDDYQQNKRNYEIKNLKREIELDKECALEDKKRKQSKITY